MMVGAVKHCACGRYFDADGWQQLPLVGKMDDGEGGELEIRNCRCGSSISVPVERETETSP